MILYEIKLTISKALAEKVVTESEGREIQTFIEELEAEVAH